MDVQTDLRTVSDADWFTLDGKFLECKVVKVYDGDSVTIVFSNTYYRKGKTMSPNGYRHT